MAENSTNVGPWSDFQAPQGGPWEDFPQAAPSAQPSGLDWSKIGSMAINDVLNLPGNIYQSVKNAVMLPGNVAQGNAVVPQSANMPGGEDTSQIGNVFNLAGMGVRPSASTFGKVMAPSEAKLKAASDIQYPAAESIPIELVPKAMDLTGKSIKSQLNIDPALAPTTFKVLDGLSDYWDKGSAAVLDLRKIQRSLGRIRDNNPDATERLMAGRSLESFNAVLENLDQAPSALAKGTPGDAAEFSALIKEANGNYTAYKHSQALTQRGEAAQYEANAANSGMNTGGRLNAKVAQILKNPKLLKGYDTDTIEAFKQYNAGSRAGNVMRFVSNALGGGGGLGMVAAEGLGGFLGVPNGVLGGTGVLLKSLGNKSALNKFQDIGSIVRANSPLARSGEISVVQPRGILGYPPRITIPLAPGNESGQ